MGPRISWIIVGLTFLVSQSVFCKKVHPSHKKALTANPGKKATIGGINLKKHPIKPEDCKDSRKDCHRMPNLRSTCLLNFKYMMDNCKLTCRFCSQYKADEITECKDRNPKCAAWSKARDCIHYSPFMKTNCIKSCKLCGSDNDFIDKDEQCPDWAKNGMCKLNKKEVPPLCPYSCRKYKKRTYHDPPVLPIPSHASDDIHTLTAHKRRPTPPPTRPPPMRTEEEKEDDEEAQKEWQEEQINRENEKEEQAREKLGLKMRPDVRSPTPPSNQQPAPVPAPETERLFPGEDDDDLSNEANEPDDTETEDDTETQRLFPGEEDDDLSNEADEPDGTETEDETNEHPNVRVKKRKDKSKLLILIGETKRNLKKERKN